MYFLQLLDIPKKLGYFTIELYGDYLSKANLKSNDEVMAWWYARPRSDRRGNLRAVARKDGKIAHLYRYYLNGEMQEAINFSHKWTLDEIKAVIAQKEAQVHSDEVAKHMGFTTAVEGETMPALSLAQLIRWHIREKTHTDKPRTLRNHEAFFKEFVDFIGGGDIMVEALQAKQMYEYYNHLRGKGNSALTATNKIKGVRSVFAHAKIKQQIPTNPFAEYQNAPVPPSKERDILTAKEMNRIGRMILRDKRKYWAQIYVAWKIMCRTGMRGADCLRLEYENIDWERKTLSFKMAKRRDLVITIPIRSDLFQLLKKLKGRSGKIFSFDGKWSEQVLTKRFGYYIRQLKGDEFVEGGSHTPRHSLNQIMLDNDVPYEYRCFFTGHAIPGEQKKYLHQKQKSHIDKLRAIIEALPLD